MPLIKRLRTTGLLEGLSYLFLLGIAMPLKYIAKLPIFVQIGGSLHGLFFVLFCITLFQVTRKYQWSLKEAGMAFVASLIPFGTFVLDRKLRQLEPAAE